MNEPPRRHDRATIAVLGGALALLIAAALYLAFSDSPKPEQTASSPAADLGTADRLARSVREMFDPAQAPPRAPAPAPPAKPIPPPQAAEKSAPPPQQPAGPARIEPGRTWRYSVKVEPEVWRDVTLTYRSIGAANAIEVQTEFRHAGGASNFRLGTFAPNHPSHVQVRFPGFFMHAAYLELPLQQGMPLEWGWAWQLPDNRVRDGRLKRYRGVVSGWETVAVPAGRFRAARIDADLYYVDEGRIQASARETLWYAPDVRQFVKVVREGRTPDEGGNRIVAELAEYR